MPRYASCTPEYASIRFPPSLPPTPNPHHACLPLPKSEHIHGIHAFSLRPSPLHPPSSRHPVGRMASPFQPSQHEAHGFHLRTLTPHTPPLPGGCSQGPSFSVEGWRVTWQQWDMRLSFNGREGLVLHNLAYCDPDQGGRSRPVLHRGSIVEMCVPYAGGSLCV